MLNANFASRKAVDVPQAERPVVLVVDDEPQIGLLLARQLRNRFDVVLATSGAEALGLLHNRKIAVVVSDQRMPEMTGSELLTAICAESPDVVRILLTGYSDLDAVVRAVNDAKIFFYLTKPWQQAEIERVLESAVEHHRLLHENRALIDELRAANALLERRVAERTEELKAKAAELGVRNEELETANARIEEVARTDALTGVPNRRHFLERLAGETARASRNGTALSFLFIDLDHFKRINDDFGHEIGDAVLVAAAGAMRAAVRPYDLLARWGGEEFVVMLPATTADQASAVAERLRERLVGQLAPGCPRAVTGSFGVACLRDGEGTEDVLRRADEAAYRAKQAGRNRVERELPHVAT